MSHLASDEDRRVMEAAMEKAAAMRPQEIEVSFSYRSSLIDHLCHIYKGGHGFFIGGWRRPENIIRLSSYQK